MAIKDVEKLEVKNVMTSADSTMFYIAYSLNSIDVMAKRMMRITEHLASEEHAQENVVNRYCRAHRTFETMMEALLQISASVNTAYLLITNNKEEKKHVENN